MHMTSSNFFIAKLSILVIFLCSFLDSQAEEKITFKGKLESVCKSKNIYAECGAERITIPVNEDGSFSHVFSFNQPNQAYIKTDSCRLSFTVWLEQGEYYLDLREFQGPQKKELELVKLQANGDARLYEYVNEMTRKVSITNLSFWGNFLDSIIHLNPKSLILPIILQVRQPLLGDSLTRLLMEKIEFSTTHEQSIQSKKSIEAAFSRNKIIKKEEFIESFTMNTHKGEAFSLNSLSNKKIILIDFWASWCAPCRLNHKDLKMLYDQYKTKGFQIVGLSLDEERKEWLDAIKEDKIDWINISDLKGYDTHLAKKYSLKGIPFNLVLNGAGKIIATNLDKWELEALLKKL